MSSVPAAAASVPRFDAAAYDFAKALTGAFAVHVPAQPEDQLKAPILDLLRNGGTAFGHAVAAVTEAHVTGLGARPDVGVTVGGLLTGYVELKAPGRGARPEKFVGHDREQWQKFQSLPNLIYTDGSEWSLYRTGELVQRVTLPGDATMDGAKSFGSYGRDELARLLRDFFLWGPVVPTSPRSLAQLLAPLCRLLRQDVLAALGDPSSAILQLAREWRGILFPEADNCQFADAYAQTVTYALLLAHMEGAGSLSVSDAVATLNRGHGLLAQALRVLDDPLAEKEIGLGVGLLRRIIEAVDVKVLERHEADPWLYFYEDFLAAYDPKLRKDRGVYYTPVEVVKTQVTLVAELLEEAFHKPLAFAADDVVLLDPAAGTGTYPLAALAVGAERVRDSYGDGAVKGRADVMARNVHAFEILVGPYAVAHLRLTQLLQQQGATLGADDVRVYLTDTLESPTAVSKFTAGLLHKRLTEEHERAQKVKTSVRVLVCIGNPPYDRQEIESADTATKRKGGWVRFGDGHPGERPIFEDFLEPARAAGAGVHLKNLYNDYVYFWRWALWKVFDSTQGPGIVSFITASSYLRGPGFVGMRQVMRETFDELWIVDLEGDNLGPRKTENVFDIQTPVAIAIGVRYGAPNPSTPARVRYARVTGSREQKLAELDSVTGFGSFTWEDCFEDWMDSLLPEGAGNYYSWPKLTDLFPWQHSGVQFKRTWPIGETPELLRQRWAALLALPTNERAAAFRETPARLVSGSYGSLLSPKAKQPSISTLKPNTPPVEPARYGFRSFDRQWVLPDVRLADRIRPPLWAVDGPQQVYLTSLLTTVLGLGPAVVVTSHVPDLHYFRGSFGGADAIPFWRDAEGTKPNITAGLLDTLATQSRFPVAPEDFLAYCYAVLSSPEYVNRFSEELTVPGPRVPITADGELFKRAADFGRRLLWLHSFGERFVPSGQTQGSVPKGSATCTVAVPTSPTDYPNDFEYDAVTQTLRVGKGAFAPVAPEVWEFSVSGLRVVDSWLGYRMREAAGRSSSPLDRIRPERWTAHLTEELLQVLWVLEATLAMFPGLAQVLDEIVTGATLNASQLPTPADAEREPPPVGKAPHQLSF